MLEGTFDQVLVFFSSEKLNNFTFFKVNIVPNFMFSFLVPACLILGPYHSIVAPVLLSLHVQRSLTQYLIIIHDKARDKERDKQGQG